MMKNGMAVLRREGRNLSQDSVHGNRRWVRKVVGDKIRQVEEGSR